MSGRDILTFVRRHEIYIAISLAFVIAVILFVVFYAEKERATIHQFLLRNEGSQCLTVLDDDAGWVSATTCSTEDVSQLWNLTINTQLGQGAILTHVQSGRIIGTDNTAAGMPARTVLPKHQKVASLLSIPITQSIIRLQDSVTQCVVTTVPGTDHVVWAHVSQTTQMDWEQQFVAQNF